MKYYPRLRVYKASKVAFYPDHCEAYSYDWWLFVRKINGLVVFNSFHYSQATCGHQSKVRHLLARLGIRIDLFIEAPDGLQNIHSAISYYASRIADLKAAINKKRSHKRCNLQRLDQIAFFTTKINEVNQLLNKNEVYRPLSNIEKLTISEKIIRI